MTSSEVHTPGVGDLVADRYRIDSVIGVGGMAVVYRALDEDLGRPVALKVFRANVVDAASVSRQAEEIRLIASLDHPALVTLYDAVPASPEDEHSTGVLVMQLVEGRDLRNRLADEGALPSAAVAAIGADVASALAYVHGRNVIHRDVSPANVLLPDQREDGSPAARLADFGIARLIDSAGLTQTGTVIGTATYLSPEQAEGATLTEASDIYSLGLTLLEALTGDRAFPGTAIESVSARLVSDPLIPGTLGAGWSILLSAMTSREPGSRPSALEVLAALRELESSDDGPDSIAATALMPTPTKVMPAAAAGVAASDAATEVLRPTTAAEATRTQVLQSKTTTTPPAPSPRPRDQRRALVVVAVIAAAAIVALIVATLAGLGGPAGPPAQPESSPTVEAEPEPVVEEPVEPTYPVVEGELGSSLAALQQLVAYGTLDEELAGVLQQQVLGVSTSAASGDFDSALDQLESVKDVVDDARGSELIDEGQADELRRAIDAVKKELEASIDARDDDDDKGKPGKGPKNG